MTADDDASYLGRLIALPKTSLKFMGKIMPSLRIDGMGPHRTFPDPGRHDLRLQHQISAFDDGHSLLAPNSFLPGRSNACKTPKSQPRHVALIRPVNLHLGSSHASAELAIVEVAFIH